MDSPLKRHICRIPEPSSASRMISSVPLPRKRNCQQHQRPYPAHGVLLASKGSLARPPRRKLLLGSGRSPAGYDRKGAPARKESVTDLLDLIMALFAVGGVDEQTPKNGNTVGGTVLTLTGKNLGSSLECISQ